MLCEKALWIPQYLYMNKTGLRQSIRYVCLFVQHLIADLCQRIDAWPKYYGFDYVMSMVVDTASYFKGHR